MQRRTLITGFIGTVVTGGLSGCSFLQGETVQDSDGDGVIDSEDYAPNDPEVQEKSDIETQSTATAEEIETQNSELIGTAVGNYQSGYDGMKTSIDLLNTLVDSYGNESYGLVITGLEGFENDTETFATSFSDAAEAAVELGDTKVAEAAYAGETVCQTLGNAGERLRAAAKESQNDNLEAAEDALAQSQSYTDQAIEERKDVMDAKTVRDRLL